MNKHRILAIAPFLLLGILRGSLFSVENPDMYPVTIAVVQNLYVHDYEVYETFRGYAQEASIDGQYRLQALFSALAESKAVHLNAMERILQSLGIGVGDVRIKPVPVSRTDENLKNAYRIVGRLPQYYAVMHKQGRGESYRAVSYLFEYLRKTANQYLALLDRVRSFNLSYEQEDLSQIDARFTTYYVCEVCGAVTYRLPQYVCPICFQDPSHYQPAETGITVPPDSRHRSSKKQEATVPAIIPVQ
jgi:rubrerythrin